MRRIACVLVAVASVASACRTAAPSGGEGPPAAQATAGATAPASHPSPVAARARVELSEGRLAGAQRLFEQAAAEAPGDPEPQAGLARVAFATGRLTDAVAHADRALALGAGPELLVLRGRARAFLRQLDEAVKDLEDAAARSPADADAWAALVAVQVARGDAHEARRAFGELRRRAGDAAAIDRAWTQLVGIRADPVQPQEALDRCARGHAAALAERWADAEHEYVNGLKRAERFEWCYAALAYAIWKVGDAGGAEVRLRRAVDGFDPAKPELRADARGLLAEVLIVRGKHGDAAQEARAALAVRPERAALLETLARACDGAGDAACARDAWTRLLPRPPLGAAQRSEAERRVAALGGAPTTAGATP
jgi:predicted Zn-dependent protease